MNELADDASGIPVPLTQGYIAFVSPEDFERVNAYRWCASFARGKIYAKRGTSVNGRNKTIRMHRFILGVPDGAEVDHVDGDGLNNRRRNLREATHRQNIANTGKRQRNRSGYKGVSPMGSGWSAYSQRRFLGTYDTAEEAARAHDTAERRAFGEFARLNFPDDQGEVAPRRGGIRRTNTSGHSGVSFRKAEGKWTARIPHDGRRVFLGYFETAELAAAAIARKSDELNANQGNEPE